MEPTLVRLANHFDQPDQPDQPTTVTIHYHPTLSTTTTTSTTSPFLAEQQLFLYLLAGLFLLGLLGVVVYRVYLTRAAHAGHSTHAAQYTAGRSTHAGRSTRDCSAQHKLSTTTCFLLVLSAGLLAILGLSLVGWLVHSEPPTSTECPSSQYRLTRDVLSESWNAALSKKIPRGLDLGLFNRNYRGYVLVADPFSYYRRDRAKASPLHFRRYTLEGTDGEASLMDIFLGIPTREHAARFLKRLEKLFQDSNIHKDLEKYVLMLHTHFPAP